MSLTYSRVHKTALLQFIIWNPTQYSILSICGIANWVIFSKISSELDTSYFITSVQILLLFGQTVINGKLQLDCKLLLCPRVENNEVNKLIPTDCLILTLDLDARAIEQN